MNKNGVGFEDCSLRGVCCIPRIFEPLCFFIFINVTSTFFHLLFDFFVTHCCLVTCYLAFICLCFSYFFLTTDFHFHPFVVRQDAWYDSIFLNLLRISWWPDMWSILEDVPCAPEKHAYSAVWGWNVLWISIQPIWSTVSFKAPAVPLLIFCPSDLSIDVSWVLKSPTVLYHRQFLSLWLLMFASYI